MQKVLEHVNVEKNTTRPIAIRAALDITIILIVSHAIAILTAPEIFSVRHMTDSALAFTITVENIAKNVRNSITIFQNANVSDTILVVFNAY